MTLTDQKLEDYIIQHIDPEEDTMYELNRYTHLKVIHPRMISGHLQGKILRMLSFMVNPEFVLEIGTYTGYATISLAQGIRAGGQLHTIEINDEIADIPSEYISKMNLQHVITQHIGDALEIIPHLDIVFDLIFIDGEKSQYIEYYQLALEKLRPGGFIIADNILWSGKVLIEEDANDHFTKGIKKFNDFVSSDNRVEKVILPIRDGLTIIRKK